MNMFTTFRALGPIDTRSVRRDSLLRWILLLPLVIALASRWLLPLLITQAEALLALPLRVYYPPIMSYALIALVPFMVGMVIGFLLLDQRDDRTLLALQVTPLSLNNYLFYRLALPMFISLIVTVVTIPISGLVHMNLGQLLLAALVAAPQAPLVALVLAAIAQNKVQGFALTKASGVVMLPPIIAYFIHSPWQIAIGIVPTYWPAKVLWALQAGTPVWGYLLGGMVYQLLLLLWLARRFNRVMTR
ncbi:MAG: hypothetical protein KC443_12880 [Anaerolineales bacterium]|nr:hypothetical protein [Anaerolineales bacterium]